MKLRVATLNDIPTLVEFGKSFIDEAPNYQNRHYCPESAEDHFKKLLKEGVIFVVEHNGVLCGGFAGGIGKDWFNNQKIAFDYVMYVKPDFRKTRVAYMLVTAFINWAKILKADRIQCGTTTGVESLGCIRLYKHFGLREYGTVLDMELAHD
ncbi:GNAT family N-acetyltransferase [Acinetobacter baumannii]